MQFAKNFHSKHAVPPVQPQLYTCIDLVLHHRKLPDQILNLPVSTADQDQRGPGIGYMQLLAMPNQRYTYVYWDYWDLN